MLYFVAILVVLLGVASASVESDLKVINSRVSKIVDSLGLKPSNKLKDTANAFVVENEYPLAQKCTGTPSLSVGSAENTCIVASASPPSSIKYTPGSSKNQELLNYYTSSTDCTGTVYPSPLPMPSVCTQDTTNNLSLQNVVTSNGTDPWKLFNAAGTVTLIYSSKEACNASAGGYYDYVWYANSYCMKDAASDGSYNSYSYTDCFSSGVTTNYFKDDSCQELTRSTTGPLGNCLETTNNNFPAFISRSCSTQA